MASVVHNPRCMERLVALSPSSLPETPPTDKRPTPIVLASMLSDDVKGEIAEGEITLRRSSDSVSNSRTSFHRASILPYVSLDDHVEQEASSDSLSPQLATPLGLVSMSSDSFSPQLATPLGMLATPLGLMGSGESAFLPIHSNSSSQAPPTDHTPFQDMDCAPSPTHTQSSNVDAPSFLGMDVGGASTQDTASQTNRVQDIKKVMDSVAQELRMHKMDILGINSRLLAKQGSSDGGEAWQSPTFKPEVGMPGKRSSSASLFSTSSSVGGESGSLLTLEPLKESLLFGTGSSPLLFGTGSSLSDVKLDPLCISQSASTVNMEESEFSIIQALFSSWPGIVTSVLGFNMTSLLNSDHTPSPPTFSSVHLLDSFTTDLLLNCSDRIIDCFVDSIVQKLNSTLEVTEDRPHEVDASLFFQDIDFADPETVVRFAGVGEVGVAVLVGRRFLSSVVRLLALEHSRVKNRFLEMQQQTRQGDYWGEERGKEGEEKGGKRGC